MTIIIDDMISSGDSILDVATELKRRKARRVFACATFGLFTNGFKKIDEAYENGIIDHILTTNLVYQPEQLLTKPWYINVDMSKYIALLISAIFLTLLRESRRELMSITKLTSINILSVNKY